MAAAESGSLAKPNFRLAGKCGPVPRERTRAYGNSPRACLECLLPRLATNSGRDDRKRTRIGQSRYIPFWDGLRTFDALISGRREFVSKLTLNLPISAESANPQPRHHLTLIMNRERAPGIVSRRR